MNIPKACRYTKDHEWVLIKDGVAIFGVTEFAQSELGEIVFCDLPQVGKKVSQGQAVCVLESTKAASDVYSPISGTVSEVNSTLSENPSIINSDPHEAGWLAKLVEFNEAEIESLMNDEQYKKLINQ